MSVVAFSVTTYHRCLRSYLTEKKKQTIVSSIVYFLWNLLLLGSRIVALSLFASVLPCFIFAHFFCSWLVLFFIAWRSKTDFMNSSFGEWLYRATVGLIWYFDWFNVVDGRTRMRTLVYHSYMLADICLLCGLWFWKTTTEPPVLSISQLYAAIVAASVGGVYVLGLILKVIYYKFFHPNVQKEDLRGDSSSEEQRTADEVDSGPIETEQGGGPRLMMRAAASNVDDVTDRSRPRQPERCNKRMKKLAENFYC